jgi:hypothetical protein
MRRQKLQLKIKKPILAVAETFCRFPMTLLFLALLAALIIFRIETPYDQLADIDELLDRIMAVLVLGIPVSLSVHLIKERYLKSSALLIRISLILATLGFLFLYFQYLIPKVNYITVTRLMMIASAAGLFFLAVPYMFKRTNFEVYIAKLLARAVTSAFFATVLALGLTAVLFAVKTLLYNGLHVNNFAYVWILTWFLFAPVHFLYDLPSIGRDLEMDQYNKVLKVMIFYIVLPIISIYTAVLYLYFIKILVTQVWPISVVAYLVVSYAAVGIAALFMIRPFLAESKWAKTFTSAYTKLIFPLLLMMFVSIGIRIHNYGLTENRYFVVVIGIWSLFAILFTIFNKGRNNSVLPISLAVVAVITVAGPFNAFSLSKQSQNQRFTQILEQNGVLENGQIISSSRVNEKDQIEISEILRYFQRNHSLEEVRYLPKGFDFSKFEETFGFPQKGPYYDINLSYFSYWTDQTPSVNITGYDVYFRVHGYRRHEDTDKNIYKEGVSSQYGKVDIAIDGDFILAVYKDQELVLEYDLRRYVQTLYDKYGTMVGDNKELTADMLLLEENDKVNLQLQVLNVNGSVNQDGIINIENLQGDVFIGFKEAD